MADEKLACDGVEEDDADFVASLEAQAKSFTDDDDAAKCWYGFCNRRWIGDQRRSRAEAQADYNAHRAQTGHGGGVNGPVSCV